MKTVLQELIDWLEDSTINQNQDKYNCILKAKELLEEEKENIIDAYNSGWQYGFLANGDNPSKTQSS